jgi:hypothetical protein
MSADGVTYPQVSEQIGLKASTIMYWFGASMKAPPTQKHIDWFEARFLHKESESACSQSG